MITFSIKSFCILLMLEFAQNSAKVNNTIAELQDAYTPFENIEILNREKRDSNIGKLLM